MKSTFLAAAVLTALPLVASAEIVTQDNLNDNWFNDPPEADTRSGGSVTFNNGPGTRPANAGSLHISTSCGIPGCSDAKAQMLTYDYASLGTPGAGLKLADITAISYETWKDSTSTPNPFITLSLNIAIDFVGNGSSFSTLVYEPFYNGPSWPCGPKTQPLIATDTWQHWDAMDGGRAIWWSTRNIPGLPSTTFCTSWAQIVAANPDARVKFGLGFNAGSGWSGKFVGATDLFVFNTTTHADHTYDFELKRTLRIDLRPGSTTNQVNTSARQLVPIAVLGEAGFNACDDLDDSSVDVRGAGPIVTKATCEDTDGDGFDDRVLHFRARDFAEPTQAECDDLNAQILLTANTVLGQPVDGTDYVDWQGPACK